MLAELFSQEIARRLRTKDHDVVAVVERPDLIGLGDEELFRRMVVERRAIMTNNVKDFVPLAHRAAVNGEDYFGLLLTSDRSMPRGLATIGHFVETLHEFLSGHLAEERCRNQVRWLRPSA
jgi:hypothetical protein